MELSFNPLWDERGQFRRDCTVYTALKWLTTFGDYSFGDQVSVNGVVYTVGNLLYQSDYSSIAQSTISSVCDGYSKHLIFNT